MMVARPRRVHLCIAFLVCGGFLLQLFSNDIEGFFFRPPDTAMLPLSIHCNRGRLGNQMCTYATLYGLSKLNGRRFVVQHCNHKHLRNIFKGPGKAPSVFGYFYNRWNTYNVSPYFKLSDAAIPENSTYIAGYAYPCSYTFFDHVRKGIRQEFQFQDHIRSYAEDVIRKANVRRLPNATYVGVHVRRGDYERGWLNVFEGVPVNMEYFREAVKYFREKYQNVLFIAVSDDRLWCIKKLSAEFGMYVPQEVPSPEYDLAVLAHCNHTILTYGTFGFWGAYLAGGEVVYFDKFLKPNTTFTKEEFRFEKMYPPYWKGIATVNATHWENGKKPVRNSTIDKAPS